MNARATRARSGRLRGTSRPPGGHADARPLGDPRQAGKRPQQGPSVAVRGNADGAHRPPQLCTPTVVTVHTDRPCSTDAVRYASVDGAI